MRILTGALRTATWAVMAGVGSASERTAGLAGSICRAKGSGQDGSARLWAQDTGNGEQTCGSQGLGTGRAAGTNRARGSGSGGIGGSGSSGERTGGFSRAQASSVLGLTTGSAGSNGWARGRDG